MVLFVEKGVAVNSLVICLLLTQEIEAEAGARTITAAMDVRLCVRGNVYFDCVKFGKGWETVYADP